MPIAALVTAAAALIFPAAPSAPAVPRFQHVVLIVFENKERDQVLGSGDAPTFDALARRYGVATRYAAVAHPSLPNYLALVSGSTHGITSDCTDCSVGGRSLADTLEAAGKTWKTYAEGLPRPGFTGASSGLYAKKHDPFLYFRRNQTQSRLARIVPLGRFGADLAARRLPSFSLVVPNLCHDMHDCSVRTGDRWLASFLRPLLDSAAMRRGVVFVVFDEGSSDVGGGGRVVALALGPLVRPHSRFTGATNHYGLLRTVEGGLGLPLLSRSAMQPPITGIWRH
ncbi:MAG: alkaline phosphatase family protein [Gaiellaceae bacterium]